VQAGVNQKGRKFVGIEKGAWKGEREGAYMEENQDSTKKKEASEGQKVKGGAGLGTCTNEKGGESVGESRQKEKIRITGQVCESYEGNLRYGPKLFRGERWL